MRRRYELTDEQYDRLQLLLSGKPGDPGRNADNNRRFLNAVLWIARTGAPWADLPERFGKHDTRFINALTDGRKRAAGRRSSKPSGSRTSTG